MQDENRIIHLWREILNHSIERNATDIHIEPCDDYTLIRCRVDGVLQTHRKINFEWHEHLVAHIKIQANLDIAEKRLPQDGRLSIDSIDCRVSCLPTLNGEKIVVRILFHNPKQLDIENLGLNPTQLAIIKKALEEPQGLCLVTGPTGSGKTVTLYSCLNQLNDGTRNISSVEDPVEIRMAGINQISINSKIGFDFSVVLRSLLRQDPDIILIGEIRDAQTANIALQAAQTGHLVFASLHTNNTVSAVDRLINLDCDRDLIASCLHLVSAQRLIRKICPNCLGQSHITRSCTYCNKTGYSGRLAVHEVLGFNADLRKQLRISNNYDDLWAMAKSFGMTSLFENAIKLVDQRMTNLSEIHRQIGQYH